MSLSISPLSPEIGELPSLSSSPYAQSPEVQVDQLEQEALSFAQYLSKALQDDYKSMVRREIAHIRSIITTMRARGFGLNTINDELSRLFKNFFESKNRFLEENKQFAINKVRVCDSNQATANKIKQCTRDFSAIVRIPIDDDEDDFQGAAKDGNG